jgi:hypothetical protein
MFRPEFAGRFLDQQNLTIDGVAHDVPSLGVILPLALSGATGCA